MRRLVKSVLQSAVNGLLIILALSVTLSFINLDWEMMNPIKWSPEIRAFSSVVLFCFIAVGYVEGKK